MDFALLLLRLTVGLLVAGHGAQKLFGWFSGAGLAGATGWLGSMGFRPARFWSLLSAGSEFFGGVLFALGLFSPLGSLGIGASMLMAITRVHWPKVWATNGGFELPLTYLAVAIAVALTGPGAISVDSMLGIVVPAALTNAGVVVALVLWAVGMATSSGPQQAPTAARR